MKYWNKVTSLLPKSAGTYETIDHVGAQADRHFNGSSFTNHNGYRVELWREKSASTIQAEDVLYKFTPIETSNGGDAFRSDDVLAAMQSYRQPLEQEVEQFKAWKESAMTVMNNIDLQECAKVIGLPWGADISTSILPALKSMKAEVERLKQQAEGLKY